MWVFFAETFIKIPSLYVDVHMLFYRGPLLVKEGCKIIIEILYFLPAGVLEIPADLCRSGKSLLSVILFVRQ